MKQEQTVAAGVLVQKPIVPPVPQQATLFSLSPAALTVSVVAPDMVVAEVTVVKVPVVAFSVVIATVPSVAAPTTTRVPLALRFWNTVDIF